jgi:hypothetical protein
MDIRRAMLTSFRSAVDVPNRDGNTGRTELETGTEDDGGDPVKYAA